ncbi:MAG: thioredoxin family protein [Candidatus Hydrogenedentes bacterium]|nr:thioredoxin family protein [Candidatus Hydrogenedentota bacterium]
MSEAGTVNIGSSGRNITLKAGIVLLLAAAVAATLYAKQGTAPEPESSAPAVSAATDPAKPDDSEPKLPLLLDLGATKCVPCKAMAPILEELKVEQAAHFRVVFVDVWKNPDDAKKHKINLIPTQIFFDADGKELFRHEGFFGKEDILAKWRELGVSVRELPGSGH